MEFLKKLNKENHKFNLMNEIKTYILIFMAGGFVGYIYELLFYLIMDNKLLNPGFLYGPFLPVYAWGSLLMAILLKRFKKHPLIIFLLAIVITGVLEYLTGYIMLQIWHRRWWDYTGLFLNIGGFVCIRSVITFAIGGLFLIYLIEPLIRRLIKHTKPWIINTIIIIFFSIYFIDNYFSKIYRNPR